MDNSSSRHTDEKKNDILVLDKGSTDRLGNAAIKVEATYSVNITKSRKKICLSLHYNLTNRFLYASGIKIHQFKAKDSEVKPCPLQSIT